MLTLCCRHWTFSLCLHISGLYQLLYTGHSSNLVAWLLIIPSSSTLEQESLIRSHQVKVQWSLSDSMIHMIFTRCGPSSFITGRFTLCILQSLGRSFDSFFNVSPFQCPSPSTIINFPPTQPLSHFITLTSQCSLLGPQPPSVKYECNYKNKEDFPKTPSSKHCFLACLLSQAISSC